MTKIMNDRNAKLLIGTSSSRNTTECHYNTWVPLFINKIKGYSNINKLL